MAEATDGAVRQKDRTCQICGEDCSGDARVKDTRGRYFHTACVERVREQRRREKQGESATPDAEQAGGAEDTRSAGDPALADTAVGVPPAHEGVDDEGFEAPDDDSPFDSIPAPGRDPSEGPPWGGERVREDLINAYLPDSSAKDDAEQQACPSCMAPLPAKAVLCVQCGQNLRTGAKVGDSAAPTGKGRRASRAGAHLARFPMAMLLALLGAVAAGAVGAAAWSGVIIGVNAELGWIAVLVGLATGFGAAFGAGAHKGMISGAIACLVSLAAIGAGKVVPLVQAIDTALASIEGGAVSTANPAALPDSEAIWLMIDTESLRRQRNGEPLPWPEGMTWEDAFAIEDYPPDVVADCRSAWGALTPAQRKKKKADLLRDYGSTMLSHEIAMLRTRRGQDVFWAKGMSLAGARILRDYPLDVVDLARMRWDGMTLAERDALLRYASSDVATLEGKVRLAIESMKEGYTPRDMRFDVIWGLLAIGAAFAMGSGVYEF